jgi:hypothetical protein
MATDQAKLEPLEGFSDIDVIARAHDTSIWEKGSNPSKFELMLAQLQGQPLPPLPATPGRIVKAPPAPEPEQDAADLATAAIWQELAGQSDNEGSDHD